MFSVSVDVGEALVDDVGGVEVLVDEGSGPDDPDDGRIGSLGLYTLTSYVYVLSDTPLTPLIVT